MRIWIVSARLLCTVPPPSLCIWKKFQAPANAATPLISDIDLARTDPKELDLSEYVDSPSVDPPLVFQSYDVERWLVHPDWKEAVIDVTDMIGTENLRVCLLHPVDLVVTKLARCGEQEWEDGQLLRERYISDRSTVGDRILEAVKYWSGSDRERAQVERAYEVIFEETIKVPRIR